MKSKSHPMAPGRILLPREDINMTDWAVIACDQFTSHPAYWKALRASIKDAPSTLHMILPEVELTDMSEARIETINQTIRSYQQSSILKDHGDMFVLVERLTSYGHRRLGLLATVDLEDYGFLPQSKEMIRATEDTIISRIPPRVLIRKNATLELTHTMVLVNDKTERLIETLDKEKDVHDVLYDFDLNMGGGHVKGYAVRDTKRVINMFQTLVDPKDPSPLVFVVGDGNHSLAAAKTHWDDLKHTLPARDLDNHPARHAMVEIVSLYDDGLSFEGIHRVVFGIDTEAFVHQLKSVMDGDGVTTLIINDQAIPMAIPSHPHEAYERLQTFMTAYLEDHLDATIDYVHGDDEVQRIVGSHDRAVGILMPRLDRDALFEIIKAGKVLPLKSFSIGHATEKRYYIEARSIL
jgi:uncharacterized protein (DUF1015 family)